PYDAVFAWRRLGPQGCLSADGPAVGHTFLPHRRSRLQSSMVRKPGTIYYTPPAKSDPARYSRLLVTATRKEQGYPLCCFVLFADSKEWDYDGNPDERPCNAP